jgi:hypothetical protein
MEFPEGADMKPPGGHDALLGAFYLLACDKSNKLYRKGGCLIMLKKTLLVLICFIGLIIFVPTLHGQGSKKTITLPSGEVVWDLNGEWDAFVENYGPSIGSGSYPQIWEITQKGSSFIARRMIDDPWNQKGSVSCKGELDKSGFKKVRIIGRIGNLGAIGKISDDGNKIIIDDTYRARVTATRK